MFSLMTLLLSLLAAIGLHVCWCRSHPKGTVQTMTFVLFAGCALAGDLLFYKLRPEVFCPGLPADSVVYLPVPVSALTLYLLLVVVYILFYHSIFVFSPSRVILLALDRKEGCSEEEILRELTDEEFIKTRLDELVKQGFVKTDGRLFWITARARLTAGMYELYQRLLGRDKGG